MSMTIVKKSETIITEAVSRTRFVIINGKFAGFARSKRQLNIRSPFVKSPNAVKFTSSMHVGKRIIVSKTTGRRTLIIGSNDPESLETIIEQHLNHTVNGGYKQAISAFLAGNKQSNLEEYKKKFQNLERLYFRSLEKYKNVHRKEPKFQNFKNWHYLFKEYSDTLIKILDVLIKKEEIPFEIYNELSFIDKLNALRFLKRDWNSYGARKINPKIISQAIEFIEANESYYNNLAFVAPLPDGGVHLAYKKPEKRIEINFNSPNDASVRIKAVEKKKTLQYKKSQYNKILKDNL